MAQLIENSTVGGKAISLKEDLENQQKDLSSSASGKGASLIGINDSANLITATTVEGALAEIMTKANSAFQSASDGKGLIASAITGKGQTASGTDSFAQLATAISKINTGKKWASGTVTMPNLSSSVTVTGLSFTPSMIIIFYSSGLTTSPAFKIYFPTFFNKMVANDYLFAYYSGGTSRYYYSNLSVNELVKSGSFTLEPTGATSNTVHWYAIE